MSNDIVDYSLVDQELKRLGIDLRVGDIVISDRGGIMGYIVKFNVSEYKTNGGTQTQYNFSVAVQLREDSYVHRCSFDEFLARENGHRDYYVVRDKTLDQLVADAFNILAAPPQETPIDVNTTAITTSTSVEMMQVMADILDEQRERQLVLRAVIEGKLSAMRSVYSEMDSKLRYLRRVMGLLETYLGVYQEATLIRDGSPALIGDPVVVRQSIQYMDEIVADIEMHYGGQRGIDFETIDLFDAWLASGNHINEVAPEDKCIVALRPSRQNRRYSENPFVQVWKQEGNEWVYLVVRNGDKIWRIYTAMKMGDLLFPPAEIMEKLYQELDREDQSASKTLDLKNKELDWRQHALLLEGLLQRTDMLHPLPQGASFLHPESFARGYVQMIRDGESLLNDGHKPFKDWHREQNAKVERGHRILFLGVPYRQSWESSSNYYSGYFGGRYYNNYPNMPSPGIYTVEEVVERKNTYTVDGIIRELRFLYLPSDNVYYGDKWGEERQKRVSFYLDLRDDRECFINYDDPTLDEVNAYIANRLERRDYLDMLPVLIRLRMDREAEREQERGLVNLIVNELQVNEERVWETVEWWKTKTIAHRYIASDDAKAWRMIRRRISNKNEEE